MGSAELSDIAASIQFATTLSAPQRWANGLAAATHVLRRVARQSYTALQARRRVFVPGLLNKLWTAWLRLASTPVTGPRKKIGAWLQKPARPSKEAERLRW